MEELIEVYFNGEKLTPEYSSPIDLEDGVWSSCICNYKNATSTVATATFNSLTADCYGFSYIIFYRLDIHREGNFLMRFLATPQQLDTVSIDYSVGATINHFKISLDITNLYWGHQAWDWDWEALTQVPTIFCSFESASVLFGKINSSATRLIFPHPKTGKDTEIPCIERGLMPRMERGGLDVSGIIEKLWARDALSSYAEGDIDTAVRCFFEFMQDIAYTLSHMDLSFSLFLEALINQDLLPDARLVERANKIMNESVVGIVFLALKEHNLETAERFTERYCTSKEDLIRLLDRANEMQLPAFAAFILEKTHTLFPDTEDDNQFSL